LVAFALSRDGDIIFVSGAHDALLGTYNESLVYFF
jgi:hypothetical protein